jgi:outer membrane protein assembly factor BamB
MHARSTRLVWAVVIAGGCGRIGFDIGADAAAPLNVCGTTDGIASDAPWPLVRGCPTGAGRSRYVGPVSGATALPVTGNATDDKGAAVGTGGIVYVVTHVTSAGVAAYAAADGRVLWTSTDITDAAVGAYPALTSEHALLVGSNYGKISLLDTQAGALVWSQQYGGSFSSPVIAEPGVAYCGSNGYGIYALDLTNGQTRWVVETTSDNSGGVAVGFGSVYANDATGNRLIALDPATGQERLAVSLPDVPTGAPVLGVDAVYVTMTTAGLIALDPSSGVTRWQAPIANLTSPALLSDGNLVVGTTTTSIFILDRATGAELRSIATTDALTQPVLLDAADTIYAATLTGSTAITITGDVQWASPLTGQLALMDHALAVLPSSGSLAVIGP